MEVFDIAREMPTDWWEVIQNYLKKDEIDRLNIEVQKRLDREVIAPSKSSIFRAFELTSWVDLKVVILGQDPYPTKGHAHGLAFSTEPFVQPFPRSLRNIFIEIDRSIEEFTIPLTGNLEHWAQQGVLLLNTQLTTKEGEANAHAKIGWQAITSAVMRAIEEHKTDIIGMFWGKPAERYAEIWSEKHHSLITSHPSPLSVRRGFAGCGHFAEVNETLKSKGLSEIEW